MKSFIILLIILASGIVYGQQWYNSDYTICTHKDASNWTLDDYMEAHNIDENMVSSPIYISEYVVLIKNKKYVYSYDEYQDQADYIDRIMGLNRVYFNSFTDKPAFGFIYSGNSSTMEKIVSDFDIQEYFNSYLFELDLRRTLDADNDSMFILKHLGIPTKVTHYTSTGDYISDFYRYDEIRVILNFINNKLSSYYRY